MTNCRIFVGAPCRHWVYSVAAVLAVVGSVATGCDDGGGLGNVEFDTVERQLNRRWRTVMGSCWLPSDSKCLDGHQNERAPSTNVSRRSPKLAEGYRKAYDRHNGPGMGTSPTGRGPVTNRPTDADGAPPYTTTATAAAGSDRAAVFDVESACVSANDGRPCVCYMADFLDSIGERSEDDAVAALFRCSSYKPVPVAFFVRSTAVAGDSTGQKVSASDGAGGSTTRMEIDFDYVVDYQLETSKNDHYAVHYGLVGSDVAVRCLINGGGNATKINAFKWNYAKGKHKKNSTITGTDTNNLLILGLEPRDSKNYTCSPDMGYSKNDRSYVHYVIAVEKPIYDIYGTVFYNTANGSVCTPEIIDNVQKQMPNSIRSEMCPEGLSRYACNVDVESSKCIEGEADTLEINYLVTLNDKANYLARIRTSKKGRDALHYQKLLARISNVLVENLKKTLTVQIISQTPLIYTRLEPDYSRIKIKNYVSCSPGFGIREVFCGACPPHHYSQNKTTRCSKCRTGFHQPIAGSKKCVKCPSLFASGCYMREVPYTYYVAGLICLLTVFVALGVSCLYCCQEEYETDIRVIPRKIRKKFKRTTKYNLLSDDRTSSDDGSKGGIRRKFGKLKNTVTSDAQPRDDEIVNLKMTFNKIHDEFGGQIQDNAGQSANK